MREAERTFDPRAGGRRTRRASRSCGRFYLGGPQRRQTRSDLCGQVGVCDGTQPKEGSIVLDGSSDVAAFVGDEREVVVRARVARVDGERAPQQVAGLSGPALRALDERQVDDRLYVPRIGLERHTELSSRGVEAVAAHERNAQVVVSRHVFGIERYRTLKLLDRVVDLTTVLIKEAEVVVEFGALLV